MEPPGCISRRTNCYSAYSNLQQDAETGLLQAFQAFDNAIKSVGYIYWSGKPPEGNRPFLRISSLIGRNSDLLKQVNYYKQVLALIHSGGYHIPSTLLIDWTLAFVRVLRHCADEKRWDLFDTLDRLTQECLTFIDEHTGTSMPGVEYCQKLDTHVKGITELVSSKIWEAVSNRETAIRLHIARPIPAPDGTGYASADTGNDLAQLTAVVREQGEMTRESLHAETDRLIDLLPGGKKSFSIFGPDAPRIEQLRANGDPMADKNIARRYLRGLCDVLVKDRESRLPDGSPVKTTKDAVRYVKSVRGKKDDPHAGLVSSFLDVTDKHGWYTEGTIYQNVKNLGSESLTNKGLAKKAKARRKRTLVSKELDEMIRAGHAPVIPRHSNML